MTHPAAPGIHLQGGRVWAESEPGKGSAFHALWPVYRMEPVLSAWLEKEKPNIRSLGLAMAACDPANGPLEARERALAEGAEHMRTEWASEHMLVLENDDQAFDAVVLLGETGAEDVGLLKRSVDVLLRGTGVEGTSWVSSAQPLSDGRGEVSRDATSLAAAIRAKIRAWAGLEPVLSE